MKIITPALLFVLLVPALSLPAATSAEVILTLQEGLNGYAGTEDTTLAEAGGPGDSLGGSTELSVLETAGGRSQRSLLRFDLSTVRGTITGARLILHKASQRQNAPAANETIALYRVTDANSGWQAGLLNRLPEDDVSTWALRATPKEPWAGGPGLSVADQDFQATSLTVTQSGDRLDQPVVWKLSDVSFLNTWLKTPGRNAGFLLRELNATGSGADRFYSSESPHRAFRPILELTVIPAPGTAGVLTPHPPIPVTFELAEPGFVTLAIDDAQGRRVRNLVSETFFPAGKNTVWWDGLDESGKKDVSPRGYYQIDGRLVSPGAYRVRGLFRKKLDLVYEYSPYNPGTPPWPTTENKASGWLADHSAPSDVLFLPGTKPSVLIGSFIVEGGSSLAWVDLDGRKQKGMGWLGGGNWTGASHLARDTGPKPVADYEVFAATTWPEKRWGEASMELRIIGVREPKNEPILIHKFPSRPEDPIYHTLLGGLAVRDGLIVASIPSRNQLLFIDARRKRLLVTLPLSDVRGLAYETSGALLAVSGHQVVRLRLPADLDALSKLTALPAAETVVSASLEDPQNIALDTAGNLYVSDHGSSHCVKVFSAAGRPLRVIGKPGVPACGPYDEQRMNHPAGLTVTLDGKLWVAESDEAPRRISVWTLDGGFVKAFYGGVQYGGGGQLDPRDPTRYYYGTHGYGLEFHLDWASGKDRLVNIYARPPATKETQRLGSPERVIYFRDRKYFTNDQNVMLMGADIARLWIDRNGIAVPVAMAGRVDRWPGFNEEPFKALLPVYATEYENREWFFTWSDRNGDGAPQPDELTLLRTPVSLSNSLTLITTGDDLSFLFSNGYRLSPSGFSASGVPLYDLASAAPVFSPVEKRARYQALDAGDDWIVQAGGPIHGYRKGEPVWSYPVRWPGLGAMYYDPLEEPRPGQIIGLCRFAGPPIVPPGSDVGPLLSMNANNGTVSLFTRDGLFAGTLAKENRVGRPVRNTLSVSRGDSLGENTLGEEHFWINLCQTPDGRVYLVTAFGLVRVDGLDSLRRLPDFPLTLTPELLQAAADYGLSSYAAPARKKKVAPLVVTRPAAPPVIDGKLDDWNDAVWTIIRPPPNPRTTEGRVDAALAIANGRLYAAFRTGDSKLLTNTGDASEVLFKTGGALDLMLATDPAADPKRTAPVAGDLRLLVTQVDGKPRATLYRAVVPGTRTPVPFRSPWRTITLDRVDDVSASVQLAQGGRGNYEFSVPLSVIGVDPKTPPRLGDIGILRGDSGKTVERIYWHNQASGLTADVPGEAMLTPNLWGPVLVSP